MVEQLSLLAPKAGRKNEVIRKFIRQKLIKCYWKSGDQIRPDVSSVEVEKTPKVAFMLAQHTIGTLSSNQPEAIRMLKTPAARRKKKE